MIYVTGDIHGGIHIAKIKEFSKYATSDDILIICGDFGRVGFNRSDSYFIEQEYQKCINYLSQQKFTILFIDGNRENFDKLYKYPRVKKYGSWTRQVSNNIYHLGRGEIYNINGVSIFTFGGATSPDSKKRIQGVTWWKQEEPNKMQRLKALQNLQEYNYEVDYVITHAAPYDFVSLMCNQVFPCKAAELFNTWYKDINFKRWYFGHYHLDCEVNDNFTCLFNKIIPLGNKVGVSIENNHRTK